MNKTQYEKVIRLIHVYGRNCQSHGCDNSYSKHALRDIKNELKAEVEG